MSSGYTPAWLADGWTQDASEKGRCVCPVCGESVSKNAFARQAHKKSSRCLEVASGNRPPAKREETEAVVKPPPPVEFDCGKCGDTREWAARIPQQNPTTRERELWCPACVVARHRESCDPEIMKRSRRRKVGGPRRAVRMSEVDTAPVPEEAGK